MGLAAGLVMLVAGVARAGEPSPSSSTTLDLVMPGARPAVNDAYICASFDMVNMTGGTEPVHVTGFVPHAEANRAHHMLLYACSMPMSEPGIPYDCMHHAMCRWCTRSQNLNSNFQNAKNPGAARASCLRGPRTLRRRRFLKASVSWLILVSDATLSCRSHSSVMWTMSSAVEKGMKYNLYFVTDSLREATT